MYDFCANYHQKKPTLNTNNNSLVKDDILPNNIEPIQFEKLTQEKNNKTKTLEQKDPNFDSLNKNILTDYIVQHLEVMDIF